VTSSSFEFFESSPKRVSPALRESCPIHSRQVRSSTPMTAPLTPKVTDLKDQRNRLRRINVTELPIPHLNALGSIAPGLLYPHQADGVAFPTFPGTLAPRNKRLAQSNKSRTEGGATKERKRREYEP
jgi:hypothetical protein